MFSVRAEEVCNSLESKQLAAFFQPLVGLRDGEVGGFEILARWRHPEFGPILPGNYIGQV